MPGTAPDQMFPTLSAAQQERVAAQGKLRVVQAGETLVEANAQSSNFFIVITGHLKILRALEDTEEAVAIVSPGAFTGELNVLSGRRGLVRIRRC